MKLSHGKSRIVAAIAAVLVVGGWLWFRSRYEFEIVLDLSKKIDPIGLNIAPRIDDSGTVFVQWFDTINNGHPISRVENGTAVSLSGKHPDYLQVGPSFGMLGKSTYYGLGQGLLKELTCCEGDREISMHAAGEMSGAAAHVKYVTRLDSDAGTLVFYSQDIYNKGGSQEHGVFSFRDGRFEFIRPYIKGDLDFVEIFTADDIVYVRDTNSLKATYPDGTTTTILAWGDPLPNGQLGGIIHFSARAGVVAFIAQIGPAADFNYGVYLNRDGKTTLITAVEKPGQGVSYTDICTNGDTVVFAEQRNNGYVDLGKNNHTLILPHRLFVYREGKLKVLASAGDSMFGSTLGRIAIGPHSINSSGEIVFRYYLASGECGIGKASPRN